MNLSNFSIFKIAIFSSFISFCQIAMAADCSLSAAGQSLISGYQKNGSIQATDDCCEPEICPQVCGCPCPADENGCLRLYTYFLIDGGYRFDRIKNETGSFFPNNYEMFDESTTAKHLQIYTVGGKALIAFDSHWYARGFYYYGWIVDGDFSDQSLTGKQKGNTQDGLGGFGYLAPINRSCSLGFLGGWAYDEQK